MARKPAKSPTALRLMTAEEENASAVNSGGFVDESYDVEAVLRILPTAATTSDKFAGFLEFLGIELGFYRSHQEDRDRQMPVSEEIGMAEMAMDFIQETRRRLEHLPPHLKAEAERFCWKRNTENFYSFRRRLDIDLHEVSSILILAQRALEPLSGKRGAKGKPHRDRLLHSIAEELATLGIEKKGGRADFAAQIINAHGVDCPEDPREVEKLIVAIGRRLVRE